jgi:hypothetical protein
MVEMKCYIYSGKVVKFLILFVLKRDLDATARNSRRAVHRAHHYHNNRILIYIWANEGLVGVVIRFKARRKRGRDGGEREIVIHGQNTNIKFDKHHSFIRVDHRSSCIVHLIDQSRVILSCSNGIGTKLSSTICRERSSDSQCGGTSFEIKSGRIDSSVQIKIRR